MYNIPLSDNTLLRWNNIICKAANLRRITIHGFRHTNVFLLFDAGVSMKDVQQRLGHKSIKMTMDVYKHVTKQHKNKVANQLFNYMNA